MARMRFAALRLAVLISAILWTSGAFAAGDGSKPTTGIRYFLHVDRFHPGPPEAAAAADPLGVRAASCPWTADWPARIPGTTQLASPPSCHKFGGTLEGVLVGLPYLSGLGVSEVVLSGLSLPVDLPRLREVIAAGKKVGVRVIPELSLYEDERFRTNRELLIQRLVAQGVQVLREGEGETARGAGGVPTGVAIPLGTCASRSVAAVVREKIREQVPAAGVLIIDPSSYDTEVSKLVQQLAQPADAPIGDALKALVSSSGDGEPAVIRPILPMSLSANRKGTAGLVFPRSAASAGDTQVRAWGLAAATVLFAAGGLDLLYGSEVGLPHGTAVFEGPCMWWPGAHMPQGPLAGAYREDVYALLAWLAETQQRFPELASGELSIKHDDPKQRMFAFEKASGGKRVIVAINYGDARREVLLNVGGAREMIAVVSPELVPRWRRPSPKRPTPQLSISDMPNLRVGGHRQALRADGKLSLSLRPLSLRLIVAGY